MQKIFSLLLIVIVLTVCGCSVSPQPATTPAPAATVESASTAPSEAIKFPRIDRHPAPANWQRGDLTAVPTYDPSSDQMWQMDLRSYNLSGLDLRGSAQDLAFADFDSQTKWPPADHMPPDFDWQKIMEVGKNPGLGVRQLHAQGITGRGVGLAIIDQPLLVEHQEYAERLRLYEEINVTPDTESQMHGPAVASIAVGKTVGVAPQADLYYIGSWTGDWGAGTNDFTWNFKYYAQAIRRILEINRQLPAGSKIRAIAMQVGWSPDQAGYDDINQAVKEARAAGVFVASSSIEQIYGFKFNGLGRPPLGDPDQFASYEPGMFWAGRISSDSQLTGRLLVPMDSRTTASPGGAGEYAFYRQGGWSWSIPYIAGVYTLAAQVDPAITPDRFWELALQTGKTIQITRDGKAVSMGPILDPLALVAALQVK